MMDYLLDKNIDQADNRLTMQEKLQDPATHDFMNRIGIKRGWRCLEVGAGRGSIASWLCEKTGPEGHVTAIDSSVKFLRSLSYPNLEVLENDITIYNPGVELYDLIHARDVLVHLSGRQTVLKKLAAAVKSGGWILLEEPDAITDTAGPLVTEDQRVLYLKVTRATYAFLQERGLDPYVGRKLLEWLKSLGFINCQAEGRVRMFSGGLQGIKSPHMMAFEQLRDDVVKQGKVTGSEFSRFLDLSNDSSFCWQEAMTMSVWGQRPIKTR
jgi:2-polyprenyl-3-methyl-5-hydroxy-6-metoxy-1,4-benzoquinol methylase